MIRLRTLALALTLLLTACVPNGVEGCSRTVCLKQPYGLIGGIIGAVVAAIVMVNRFRNGR